MTLFGDPVTRRPNTSWVPEITIAAGRAMATRLRRFHPDFFGGAPAVEEQFARAIAKMGRSCSPDAIALKLKRDGWDDYSMDEGVLNDLSWWDIDISSAEEAFETQWAKENGLDLTFSGTVRAKLLADGTPGWAVNSPRYASRAAVLFLEDGQVGECRRNGELAGGVLMGAELIEVDPSVIFHPEPTAPGPA